MIKLLLIVNILFLHADQLGVEVGSFNVRIGYLFSIFLLIFLISRTNFKLRIQRSRLTWLFLVVMYTSLSSIWSSDPVRTLFMSALTAVTLILYFITPYFLATYIGPIKLLRTYILCAGLVGIYATLQVAASTIGFHDYFANQVLPNGLARGNAFAHEPSFYLLYMIPVASILLGSTISYANLYLPYNRLMLLMFFFFCAISMSSSFVVAPVVFILLYAMMSSTAGRNAKYIYKSSSIFRSIATLISFIVLITAFSYLYGDYANDYFFRLFTAENILEHHSSAERLVQTYNSYIAFLDAPILGHGLGGVGQYLYNEYLGGRDLFIAPSRPFEKDPVPRFFDPMNVATELLSSYGIIGSVIYASIYIIVFRDMIRCMRLPSLAASKVHLIYVLMISLLLMIIWQNINQGLYRTYTWFFIGMIDSIRLALYNNQTTLPIQPITKDIV